MQTKLIKLAAVELVPTIIFFDGLRRQVIDNSDFGIAEMIYASFTAIIAALVLTRRKKKQS